MISSLRKTIEAYEKIASYYAKTHSDTIFWSKEFKVFQKLVKGKRVIDIGCGAGRDAILFIKNDFDYIGIDISKAMLGEAKNRVKKGKFIQMNICKLKFPKNSFDCFWAAASLLHIPKKDIPQVLSKLKNIIIDNAIGFISLKEKRSIGEGMIKEEKFDGIRLFFTFYKRGEFDKLLEQNGFLVLSFHVLKEKDTNWLCYFVKKN